MIFYLTYNDLPSGIFSSQVIDVVKFLRAELNTEIRLVSFISLRNFKTNKAKIVSDLPDAIVLPMFPGVHRWKYNSFTLKKLCRKLKPGKIIGRSVLATQLALKTGIKTIIYDGRGAIDAECREYNVIVNAKLVSQMKKLERSAVLNSDYRIAVSEQLVKFWQNEFGYAGNNHAVIPCTLNKAFESCNVSEANISAARKKLGLLAGDTVFVYSGSVAGWQSFELLHEFIEPILREHSQAKLVFLSAPDPNIARLQSEFQERVICISVKPSEVPLYLMAADYGLLIREESVTNKVASPVKFAEYLACGLKVIISDNLGDYSAFVQKNLVGCHYKQFKAPENISLSQKQTIRLMALARFTKKNYLNAYQKIVRL